MNANATTTRAIVADIVIPGEGTRSVSKLDKLAREASK